MAYKFQFGQAILSGALDQEGDIDILDSGELKMAGTTTIANNRNATLAAVTATTLGHTDDTDLITLADTSITIAADTALTYKGTAITSTGAELNLVDGAGAGNVVNNKAVIYNANGVVIGQSLATADDGNIGNVTNNDLLTLAAAEVTVKSNSDFTVAKAGGFKLSDGAVTSTAAELNLLDTAAAGTVVNSKAVIYSGTGAVTASNLSSSNGLSISQGAATITKAGAATFTAMDADNIKIDGNVISSTNSNGNIELTPAGTGEVLIGAANLNYAGDAVTSTGAELNLLDGSGAGSIVNSKAVIYSATGAVTASAVSSSGDIVSNGELVMQGNATIRGQIVNLPGVAAASLDTG
ncbi:MAG: hypothetical protein CMC43_06690, partial [Flavobacteriaceae bacterium]|nr:hypothetical protein [Flavobacteriaceae bacterium]